MTDKIYTEVEHLYHSCQTPEERCFVIADYIRRLLVEALFRPTPVAADAAISTHGDGPEQAAARLNPVS